MNGLKMQAQNGHGDVWIYDEISMWGITARMFQEQLENLGSVETITVNLNSPGGDVFDGLAIYNSLMKHPAKVSVEVDGVAASIASVIALAGDHVRMADNASFMVHNPWTFAMGEAKDLRKVAETLDLVRGQILDTYKRRTNCTEQELSQMMDNETWMTADESIRFGFAHEKYSQRLAAAMHNTGFHSRPQLAESDPPPRREATLAFDQRIRELGVDLAETLS